jgi:tripartite-type tricarboxylate transporter receptor subunit TctC
LSVIAASYRGVPQAVTDVMGGAINLAFAVFSLAIPQMKGGTLRGIGVTSPARNELTPDLPPLSQAMPGFEATIWYGLLAPAGTPAPIVNKLYAESEKFLTLPETRTATQADLLCAAIALQGPDSDSAAVIEVIRQGAAGGLR